MILVIYYDVLYCLYPNDENARQVGVGSVTDHEVVNVIFLQEVAVVSVISQGAAVVSVISQGVAVVSVISQGVAVGTGISHEVVEAMVNVIVPQVEVMENVIDVYL